MVWPFDSTPSTPQPPKDQSSTHGASSIPVKAYTPPASYRSTDDSDEELESNPFIAFRRFADDQFRHLAYGLSAVPALLSSLEERGSSSPSSRWSSDSFTDRASQPLAFMSQHFEPPLSPPTPASPEAIAHTRALLVQSRNALAAAGVAPGKILELFRDPATAPPYPFDYFDEEANGPVWLSPEWFLKSRYSPLQCETDPHLHQHGSMWRAAFEDLMCASMGQEQRAREAWIGEREDQQLYGAWAQTGRDWMLGLMCRGVVPPLLPGLYRLPDRGVMDRVWKGLVKGEEEVGYAPARKDFWNLVREVGWFDGDEREEQLRAVECKANKKISAAPQTELDAYEHFLGKANGRTDTPAPRPANPAPQIPRREPTPPQQTEKESVSKSKILSTLSTTEKTTLPDGTVTTKVVLKKRFADGSEQLVESVSTTHPGGVEESWKGHDGKTEEGSKEVKPDAPKKNGWFWG
ncbi:hypothetical protein BDZ85DRAFT_28970 [Elsinoe ampelina]|uniref:Uncharacterized protein n=1 Tax=Elsinoe ampelina TaxID=302913 RepID=A0A6A6G4D8_9PEZI|nr:hypothetical protein BDZ85DRAFT_28970 [Elsinoe ampelina]